MGELCRTDTVFLSELEKNHRLKGVKYFAAKQREAELARLRGDARAKIATCLPAVVEARGEALPVRLHVGGPPALILSAIAPLPEDVPELLLEHFHHLLRL